MACVEIRIHAADIDETGVTIQETGGMGRMGTPDLAGVPATLGTAVCRALHAVSPDDYRAAAWKLIEQLGVGAVTE